LISPGDTRAGDSRSERYDHPQPKAAPAGRALASPAQSRMVSQPLT
jgi:hypothetical protein